MNDTVFLCFENKGVMRKSKHKNGYALYDVLIALSLFALGFTSLISLNEAALNETRQALTLHQAANLAQTIMEELTVNTWQDHISAGKCIPDGSVHGVEGLFHWTLYAAWDHPELLRIWVVIAWMEDGNSKNYIVESLYYTAHYEI